MRWLLIHIAVVATLVLTGCETQVDPMEGGGPAYYVYGTLNTDSLVQTIRVEALRETAYGPPSPERPEVILSDVTTGESQACMSRPETPAYQCPAPRVVAGHFYRMQIRGERGESRVDVQVPQVSQVIIKDVFTPGTSAVLQPLQWNDTGTRPISVVVTYVTIRQGHLPDTTVVDYLPFVRGASGLREVTLDYPRDLNFYRGRVGLDPKDMTVILKEILFSTTTQGSEWERPQGTTNVENGYGFVGSQVGMTIQIPIRSEMVQRLGFQPVQ